MKNKNKSTHLISKTIALLILGAGIFFAVCDCTPNAETQEVILSYAKE